MRVRSFVPVGVVGGAMAVWACSAGPAATGANEEHLEDAVEVALGTCTLGALPSDRSQLVAPLSRGQKPHHFEASPPERVLKELTLSARITTKDGVRSVVALEGKFTAFGADGKPAEKGIFDAPFRAGSDTHARVTQADGRQYAYHAYALTAPNGSLHSVVDGHPEIKGFTALTLHWESDGSQWVMFGRSVPFLHASDAASGCSFDARGWAILANAACVDGDAGDCAAAPDFGRRDAGATDAGDQPDATTTPVADAGTTDAAGPTPAPKEGGGSYTKPNPPASPRGPAPGDDYPVGRPTSGQGASKGGASDGGSSAKSTMKNFAAPATSSDGGCSTTPGARGSASSFPLAGLAIAAVLRRRKRAG